MRVYTGGTFDLFHSGHVEFLSACRSLAGANGEVVVGLNTDEFVERFKGKKPVVSYEQRREVLLGCRYVDVVTGNFTDEDSKPTIEGVNPNLIVIGSDWHGRDYLAQMSLTWEWLREHRISLTYVARVTDVSSTQLRSNIA